MLSRQHRLRGARDIRTVFRGGRRAENEFFAIWLSREQSKTPRALVIVSRKVDKRAVARNAIKRRVREATRSIIKSGRLWSDIIIQPKPESKGLSYNRIKNILCDIINLP